MCSFLKQKYYSFASDGKFSEIFTGSIYSVAAQISVVALTMASNVFIARVYGAEAVGILAMINTFLLLCSIFAIMGTDISILRLIPEHVAKYSVASAFHIYRKTQYFVACIALVLGTVFLLSSGYIADKVFSKPHLSLYFALSAFFIIFKALVELNINAVRGLRLIRTFAIMQVIPSAVMLLILITVTLLLRSPGNPVYAQLTALGFAAVIGIWVMDRAFKNNIRSGENVRFEPIRDILSISFPIFMTAAMMFFIGQAGVIILGMFCAEKEVGYYSIAAKLASLTSFILQAVNTMAAPKFSALYHTGEIDELFHVAKKSAKLIFWTTTPILFTLVLLGKPILGLAFGRDFISAYPAMVTLVIGQFVNSISGSTGYFMNMTGHQNVLRNIIFLAALINITLSWALIPRFGVNGAAFAGTVSLVFWNLYVLLYIKAKYGRTIGYLPMLS